MIYGNYLRDKYNNTAVKLANAEGVPCVLEYSKGKNIRNYEVYGNSVQDGTPTPESPVEMLTIKECVKEIPGLRENTIRQLVTQGKLPHIRTGRGKNGKILIAKSALFDYINNIR